MSRDLAAITAPITPSLAIIGAGAVGSSLTWALADGGYQVRWIVSRTIEPARHLADQIHALSSDRPADLSGAIDIVFICVPDDAIQGAALDLASASLAWERVVVIHTSGIRTTDDLQPLIGLGALPLSFHPIQTFTPTSPRDVFNGITVTLQGPQSARAVGIRLARDLGAHPLEVSKEQKAAIHAAAAIASNYIVTLVSAAVDIGTAAGLSREKIQDAFRPLIHQTCQNVVESSPEDVLTGPVSRGDANTVKRHLDYLRESRQEYVGLYRVLAEETVRIARQAGRISMTQSRELLDVLAG